VNAVFGPKGAQPSAQAVDMRTMIAAAWVAGYYHAGYTNDSAYADKMSDEYADEAFAASPHPQPSAQGEAVAWKLVPVEPTDAMVDATHHGQPVADIWRDMIAAAPAAPAQAVPLTDEQMEAGMRSFDWGPVPHPFRTSVAFERGVRFAESHHGIAPKAAQESKHEH
jgi:hypothetical protein